MFRIVAIFLCICIAHACENNRDKGLFKNGFTSSSTTENFVDDTDSQMSAAFGDSKDVPFDNKFKVYTATELSNVKIYDHGLLLFSGTTTTTYDGTLDVFAITNQAFATPLWFKQDTGIDYKFTYKHLKKATMVETGDKAIGQSDCDLQRIATIIGDCKAEGYRDSLSDVKEALIVTWEISKATVKYYFQAVLAVNEASETHIIFLYSDPAGIPSDVTAYSTGYISGASGTTPTPNAAVCPYSKTKLATGSKLHTQSNCRCGEHTQGIYSFMTSTAADACGKSKTDFDTECAKDLITDNTMNFKMSCRPPRNPQDTCLEQVYCRDTALGYEVNINLLNAPHKTNTAVQFMSQLTPTKTKSTNAGCAVQVSAITGTSNKYRATFTKTLATDCDWTFDATPPKEISFMARVYDITETEIEKAGDIYMKATCDVLPKEVSTNIKNKGIAENAIPTASARYVEMFISNSRYYDKAVNSKIPTNKPVSLGQDLFIGVALDYGTTQPVDKVHAYGLYPYDCKVSNNDKFDTTGTNRVVQLTDGTKGCLSSTLVKEKAFYLEDNFKVASKTGTNTYGIISDTVKGTYNFVQLTGKFDAVKWYTGGSKYIYFQCKVKFCRNQDVKDKSKCWNVCDNDPTVDYVAATGRRRRDVNETMNDNPYPAVTVSTRIELDVPPKTNEEPQVECVSNVIAYSTMLALSMLLLVSMGITLMMFVKLTSRQRKRV